jgi:hypothetical protein
MKIDELEFHVAGMETLPDWRKVADKTEDKDNDEDEPIDPAVRLVLGFDPDEQPDAEAAKNRARADDLAVVREALKDDTSGILAELEAALAEADPLDRGQRLSRLIAKLPSQVGDVEATTAALEGLLLDGFIEGADEERTD